MPETGRWSLAFSAAVLFAILAAPAFAESTVQRGHDSDRVRLLSVSDAPDPLDPEGTSPQVCALSAVVGVRKVAGLGAENAEDDNECDDDKRGRRSHQKTFFVDLDWVIHTSPDAVVRLARHVEVSAPLSLQRLDTGKGNKFFALVPVALAWDGRDARGTVVPNGTYSYEVQARFTRVHDHANQQVKLIDETDSAAGQVTVLRRTPPSLTISQPQDGALVAGSTVVVAGTVSGSMPISVTVNGAAAVVAASGAFSASAPVPPGESTLTVVATDRYGLYTSKTLTVISDAAAPQISIATPADGIAMEDTRPQIQISFFDPPPSSGIASSSFHLALDGNDVSAAASVTSTGATFRTTTALAISEHTLVTRISDRAGRSAEAQSRFIIQRPAPPSVTAPDTTTNNPIITVAGGKPQFSAILIDGVERVPLSAGTTWITTHFLHEGANVLAITDRNVFGTESLATTLPVTLITIPPPPPVVSTPIAYTATSTVQLSGTKRAGTAVIINGVVTVPLNNETTWSADVPLQEGQNKFVIEAQDIAGNKSLAAGSQQAGIAAAKPVIRDLTVAPPEISPGQVAQIAYRLFATVPPQDNADLEVSVRVEAGDLLVKELTSAVQQAGPDGPSYSASWDGTDSSGRPATVNQSYRIVVSAARVALTTFSRELVDPNPKEHAILLLGSQHVLSPDKRLEVVFRPDDAKVEITPYPALSPRAGRLLTTRSLSPRGGCYRIKADRALQGASVAVLRCPDEDGRLLRPFCWSEAQQDWSPVGRANWNPSLKQLSFALPGPGLVVFATTTDVDQPYISNVALDGTRLTARVHDDTSGVDLRRLKLRKGGVDVTATVSHKLLNGLHDVLITVDGVESLDGLTLYAEDWAGHGRLFPLAKRTAP